MWTTYGLVKPDGALHKLVEMKVEDVSDLIDVFKTMKELKDAIEDYYDAVKNVRDYMKAKDTRFGKVSLVFDKMKTRAQRIAIAGREFVGRARSFFATARGGRLRSLEKISAKMFKAMKFLKAIKVFTCVSIAISIAEIAMIAYQASQAEDPFVQHELTAMAATKAILLAISIVLLMIPVAGWIALAVVIAITLIVEFVPQVKAFFARLGECVADLIDILKGEVPGSFAKQCFDDAMKDVREKARADNARGVLAVVLSP